MTSDQIQAVIEAAKRMNAITWHYDATCGTTALPMDWCDRCLRLALVDIVESQAADLSAMTRESELQNAARVDRQPAADVALPQRPSELVSGDVEGYGNARCACGHLSSQHACDHPESDYSGCICTCEHFCTPKSGRA